MKYRLVVAIVLNVLCCFSFSPTCSGSENDMRFIYCACCISYILQDWSGIDQDKVVKYIKLSQVSKYSNILLAA